MYILGNTPYVYLYFTVYYDNFQIFALNIAVDAMRIFTPAVKLK